MARRGRHIFSVSHYIVCFRRNFLGKVMALEWAYNGSDVAVELFFKTDDDGAARLADTIFPAVALILISAFLMRAFVTWPYSHSLSPLKWATRTLLTPADLSFYLPSTTSLGPLGNSLVTGKSLYHHLYPIIQIRSSPVSRSDSSKFPIFLMTGIGKKECCALGQLGLALGSLWFNCQ